jgi:sensor histidine kinase YesM
MKLVNRDRRIKYLGFDDKWFIIFGTIVLSFITDYLFTNSFGRGLAFLPAIIGWSVSLFFSLFNWLLIRTIMIQLRIRFPEFKHTFTRIGLFVIAIVSGVVFVDFIGSAILVNIAGINFHPLPKSKILSIILISMMTMAIYEAIYYYVRLKKSIRDEEQAKQIIVQAQLDALRNQAQPHFFFNTLNTLRDIIDQNSKEEAMDFVDKLSDVYRYILEAGDANLIPIRDEVKFAKAYIHIQSERFGDNLQVKWDLPEPVLDKMIVPMSLQLLLENAIKHNVVSRSNPLIINVKALEGHVIISNKIQAKSSKLPSTQLGLKNIEKRYGLISDKPVQITNNEGEFMVSLPLLNAKLNKEPI